MHCKNISSVLNFILCLVILVSCRNTQNGNGKQISMEEAYFQDYEIPTSKWGFIDTFGRTYIQAVYDEVRPFTNGLAIVNKGGKWGMIDSQNNMVIDFKYRSLFPFVDGRARFQNFQQKYGFLDTVGKIVIMDSFELAYDFSHGYAKASKNGKYGYIDTVGNWKIKPIYKSASDFENGYAIVQQLGTKALIDTNSKIWIDFDKNYTYISNVSRGICKIRNTDGYYLYDLHSNKLNGPYDKLNFDANRTNHDFIASGYQNGKWYLLSKAENQRKEIINVEKLKSGNAGMWFFKKGKLWGIMDSRGNIIKETAYQSIYRFSDSIALVQKNELWGYIDINGREVVEAIFPLAWAFRNGFARILTQEGIGYINKAGMLAFRRAFGDSQDFSENLAAYKENN